MLISYRHRFLFVHIAKTGGTSVRTALNREKWLDPWRIPLYFCSRLSSLSGHRLGIKFPRHAKVIAAMEMLPNEFFDDLFKFAIVRNPWDLQVSSFHHIRRERPHLMQGMDDFETFMNWKLNPERPYQYHIDTSIEFQSDYLIDLRGNIVVDFIGRYENLQEDFDSICEKVGIKKRTLPFKRKATDRKDYRGYYSDALAERVGEYFKADIEALGYTF